MLGGKPRFMGTRLHTFGDPYEPLIKDYEKFDWELPKEENPWFQRYMNTYRYMKDHAGDDFVYLFQGGYIGINLAVQFRGADQAYVDMYEEPDYLRRLLDYSLDFNLYLYGRVEEIVGLHNLSKYGDNPLKEYRVDKVANLSLDAYALCRPGTLKDWGMSQTQRFIDRVGGAQLHIHENSRHVIEELIEIQGWRCVMFTDGIGWPNSFDIQWDLRKRMKNIRCKCIVKEMNFWRL